VSRRAGHGESIAALDHGHLVAERLSGEKADRLASVCAEIEPPVFGSWIAPA
jgi:hypothetical protein